VDRLQVGHLHKQGSAVRQHMNRRDGDGVVPRQAVMARGILARAVAGTEAVVPALGEVVLRLFDERPVERLRELDEYAVAMHVKPARQLDRLAGVADALETAVGGGVGAPTRHAADVKLPVPGVESSAVDAGAEIADEGHDRSLSLSLDFIAEQQEM